MHIFSDCCYSLEHPYRQEHGAVVGSAQLGHTVKEDGGHLLVLVLDKAEHLEGEPAHLALPVLKNRCLRVFITSAGPEMWRRQMPYQSSHTRQSYIRIRTTAGKMKLPKEKVIT